MTAWFGLIGPARLPAALTERIQADAVRALTSPDVRTRIEDQGLTAVGSTPAQFAEFLSAELRRWGEVVRAAGIRAE